MSELYLWNGILKKDNYVILKDVNFFVFFDIWVYNSGYLFYLEYVYLLM